MSDTESVIQLPSSRLPGEREAEADSQGPLTSLFEGIPKGFEVLGVGEAPMTDQSRKPVCVDDSSSQEGAISPASAIQNRFGLPFIHPSFGRNLLRASPQARHQDCFQTFKDLDTLALEAPTHTDQAYCNSPRFHIKCIFFL